jgi:hypothetical protein
MIETTGVDMLTYNPSVYADSSVNTSTGSFDKMEGKPSKLSRGDFDEK